jgi:hypothetical protein
MCVECQLLLLLYYSSQTFLRDYRRDMADTYCSDRPQILILL